MKLLDFIRNIKQAYKLYFDTRRRNGELDSILTTFKQYNFTDGRTDKIFDVMGNPVKDAGTCARLMRHYGIDIWVGTSYGECRAVLPKSKWRNSINREVCSFKYGTFTEMNPDEVDDIYAFGKTVNEAVCKCLINAKIAGVI